MNRILTASAIVALAALAAAPAFAATATTKPAPAATTMKATPAPKMAAMAPAKPKPVTFKTLDTNNDGKLSLAEIDKVWPKIAKADFDKYDANKDGSYNRAELAAFVKGQQPPKAAPAMGTMKPAK